MNLENALLGLVFGVTLCLVAWRLGVRRRPWREAFAATLVYVALSLSLLAAGVGATESITIAVIGSALLVSAWRRFAHRPA